MPQQRTVAVVAGASRGAGSGVAVALGAHGCTVYVTGRLERSGDHALPGAIHETAQAVTAAGGQGSPSAATMATTSRSRRCSSGWSGRGAARHPGEQRRRHP